MSLLPPFALFWAVFLLFWPVYPAFCSENDWLIYLGNDSPSKSPQRSMNAAEALPPLPLPATPLRRTERKKPPPPDYLIGKVIWGKEASYTDSGGATMQIADWNLCPTDVEKLVEHSRKLELKYHWKNVNLNGFHFDPQKLPSLLFNGVRSVKVEERLIEKLRDYVMSGGMVIWDSIAGSPYFTQSAYETTSRMFPESRLRKLPGDHPLYHLFTSADEVNLKGTEEKRPGLEGVYVGSRVGVLVSKYGLGCGWNRDISPLKKLKEAKYFDVASAQKIGMNLTGYVVGYGEVGQVEGRPEMFALKDNRRPTDEFVFAQIRHEGAWNVHPNAAVTLLVKLRRLTSVRVHLKRVDVVVGKEDLCDYPFLYLSGLDDFTFSDEVASELQHYLAGSGLLLINNGLGLSAFDRAVRRELKRILPGAELAPIPLNHDIYSCLFNIREVRYTPTLESERPELKKRPYLLGIFAEGELRVIYSPYDLEAGWLEIDYPRMLGYESLSAQQLGMNLITYVMTN